MFSPPDSSDSLSHFIDTTFSYGGNVMLAAIISLLVVILFVLLLHLYAKWFLAQARHRRRTSTSVSHILGPTRFHTFTFDTTLSDSPTKGLDSSIIASIPVFVYENNGGGGRGGGEGGGLDLECVVCLSVFEEGEAGRNLPKCGHGFHVECIDMWLRSHTNCPICRAPVAAVCEDLNKGEESGGQMGVIVEEDSTIEIVIEQGVASVDNVVIYDSSPAASSSSLGCSLKRMLSRNKLENKIYPFSTCNELDA